MHLVETTRLKTLYMDDDTVQMVSKIVSDLASLGKSREAKEEEILLPSQAFKADNCQYYLSTYLQ